MRMCISPKVSIQRLLSRIALTTVVAYHARLRIALLRTYIILSYNNNNKNRSMLQETFHVTTSGKTAKMVNKEGVGYIQYNILCCWLQPWIIIIIDTNETRWGEHCLEREKHVTWTPREKEHHISFLEPLAIYKTITVVLNMIAGTAM